MHNLPLAIHGYLVLLNVVLYTGISKADSNEFAQADECGDINDITSDLYKGNITPVYYNIKFNDEDKGRVRDGDEHTCVKFRRQNVNTPEISFVLHQPISSHYISITYRTNSAKILQFTVEKTMPCKLCKQITRDYWFQTTYLICNYNYKASEINFQWTWGSFLSGEKSIYTTEICEISIYEVKPKCWALPEIANGAYRISSDNLNQYNNFKIGTNATLVCSEGFQPSKESTTLHIQCTESEIWTPSDATCSEISDGENKRISSPGYYISDTKTECAEINEISSDLYKGNLTGVHYKVNYRRRELTQVTDEDIHTCTTFWMQHYLQPIISYKFDDIININYIAITYRKNSAKNWNVKLQRQIPCVFCWDNKTGESLQTSYFKCNDDYKTTIIDVEWDWDQFRIGQWPILHNLATQICEIGIFEEKPKCGILPQISHGEYIISSGNLSQHDNFKVGTNATLVCSEGFQPSEESTGLHIQCTEIGNWTYANETCSISGIESSKSNSNIEVPVILLVVIILAILGLVLFKKYLKYKKNPQLQVTSDVTTTEHVQEQDDDDPTYEYIGPPTGVHAEQKPCDPKITLNPQDCVSMYATITKPKRISIQNEDDIITPSAPIYSEVGPFVGRSESTEYVVNDLYVSIDPKLK